MCLGESSYCCLRHSATPLVQGPFPSGLKWHPCSSPEHSPCTSTCNLFLHLHPHIHHYRRRIPVNGSARTLGREGRSCQVLFISCGRAHLVGFNTQGHWHVPLRVQRQQPTNVLEVSDDAFIFHLTMDFLSFRDLHINSLIPI